MVNGPVYFHEEHAACAGCATRTGTVRPTAASAAAAQIAGVARA
ncbi:MAG: hypothetical protein ACXVX4_17070 [Mycobacterium sp.]